MKIPDGYLPVMPYLILPGAYQFIDFMKAVFNADVRYSAEREAGVIQHAELQIQDAVIMLAEATEEYKPSPGSVFLYLEGVDEIFAKAGTNGATLLQAPVDREYGRSCGFSDAFGNTWWVSTPIDK